MILSYHDESGGPRPEKLGTTVASLLVNENKFIELVQEIFNWKIKLYKNPMFSELLVDTSFHFTDIKYSCVKNKKTKILMGIVKEYWKLVSKIKKYTIIRSSHTIPKYNKDNIYFDNIIYNLNSIQRAEKLETIPCTDTIKIMYDNREVIKKFKKNDAVNKFFTKYKLNSKWGRVIPIININNPISFLLDFWCGIYRIIIDKNQNIKLREEIIVYLRKNNLFIGNSSIIFHGDCDIKNLLMW